MRHFKNEDVIGVTMSEKRDIALCNMKLDWYHSYCKRKRPDCFKGGLLRKVLTCIACGAKPFILSAEQEKVLAKFE